MVNKTRLLPILNDAILFEEVQALPLITHIIHKLRASSLEDSVKIEIEEKLWRIQVETINHAKTLTGFMKKLLASESG